LNPGHQTTIPVGQSKPIDGTGAASHDTYPGSSLQVSAQSCRFVSQPMTPSVSFCGPVIRPPPGSTA
jgi:hypothetical protein